MKMNFNIKETLVLDALLKQNLPQTDVLLTQLRYANIERIYDVDQGFYIKFHLNNKDITILNYEKTPLSFLVLCENDVIYGVILFIEDGYIDGLEVYDSEGKAIDWKTFSKGEMRPFI